MLRVEEQKQRQKLMLVALVVVLALIALVLGGGSLRQTTVADLGGETSAETDLILNKNIDFEFLAGEEFAVLQKVGEVQIPEVYGKKNPFR